MYLLQQILEQSSERAPEKSALVSQSRRLTYREIDAEANRIASSLRHLGVARGDRVVIFADNTAETVVGIWATLKADAVFVVVNPQTRADKLAYILNDSRAAVMISDAHLAATFAEAARKSTHLRAVIVSGAIERDHVADVPGVVAYDAARAEGDPQRMRPRAIGNDLADGQDHIDPMQRLE